MTARAYRPEDFEMVREWASARGKIVIPEMMRTGFVAEDQNGPCAVVFVYLLFEVPLAILDNFFSRPDMGPTIAQAWRKLWRVSCRYLRSLKNTRGEALGYRVVRTYCTERLAPLAKSEGWQVSQDSFREIITTIPE